MITHNDNTFNNPDIWSKPMTSILDDVLILKYFGCEIVDHGACDGKRNDCMERTALRILRAMEEKIQNGDHVLQVAGDNVYDTSAQFDMDNSFHSRRNFLRLPSKHQEAGKKPHECNCEFCGSPATVFLGETSEDFLKRTACKCEQECCKGDPPHYQHKCKPAEPEKCGHPFHDVSCTCKARPYPEADSGKCYAGCEKGACPFLRSSDYAKAVDEYVEELFVNNLEFRYRAWVSRAQMQELVALARGVKP